MDEKLTILLRQSTEAGNVPAPDDLMRGELEINVADRKMYSKDDGDLIYEITRTGQGNSLLFDDAYTDGLGTQVADQFLKADLNSVKYTMQITDTVGLEYQTGDVYVIHDGTAVKHTEFATLTTNGKLVDITTDISGDYVRLLVTPLISEAEVVFARLDLGNNTSQDKSVFFSEVTTTGTSLQVVDTFDKRYIRSAKYFVEVGDGTDYSTFELNVVHDGTVVKQLLYGTLETNGSFGVVSSDISSNEVRLLITPNVGATTIKIARIDLRT